MLSVKDSIALINSEYDICKASTIVTGLELCYAEYHRKYHTIDNHILPGLKLLKEVEGLCDEHSLIEFAFWYHDAIYIPVAEGNEVISADKASYDGAILGFNKDVIGKIHAMIMATKHDDRISAKTNDEKIIHDVDLFILGSSPDGYEKYTNSIEKEFSVFPLKDYCTGRISFLDLLLQLKHIYYIEYFQNCFEEKARKNIKNEIETLKSILSGPSLCKKAVE